MCGALDHGRPRPNSYGIPRKKSAPASSQQGGTFIFVVNEDNQRQSHLFYTLKQFVSSESNEHQLTKRYINLRKKRYYDFIQTDSSELKLVVTRVTIEGEHTCVLVARQKRFELMPITNVPHSQPAISLEYADLKYVEPYKCMEQQKSLRLVTCTTQEYILVCKSVKH
jgi:hypothetical protein